MMSIAQINAMPPDVFTATFGDVAEHSPWVAERAAAVRPFGSRAAMIAAFTQAVDTARHEHQLALIRAHPNLAAKAKLTDESAREQAGAGLTALTPEELSRFAHLNSLYKSKFDFPFILAVKGASKDQILESFAARVKSTAETEFATALAQISHILRFRIEDRVSP